MGHLQSQRRQSSSSTYSLGCRRRIAVRISKNMRWSTCCPSSDASWLPRSVFSSVVRGHLSGSQKIIGTGQKLNNVAACMHIFWFGLKENHGHKIGSHYRPYQHHDKAQHQSKGASQRSHCKNSTRTNFKRILSINFLKLDESPERCLALMYLQHPLANGAVTIGIH